MHNIDSTQGEYGTYELNPEYLQPEYGQYESPSYEALYGEMETSYHEGPLSESDEMELATELLASTSEAELEQFLGSLFKKVGRGLGRFVRGPAGRALGRILKNVAKKALPLAGAALKTMVAPGIGTALGGALAGSAGQMFGLELEGLSPEDQEYEVARQVVKLAGDAVQRVALAPPTANPVEVAKSAVAAAAAQYAPGLLKGAGTPFMTSPPASLAKGRSGKWVRRGNHIILFGV
ncbi:MAG: hypothetical protein L6277_04605 [Desulfobacterales bacterium]|nr:hypothetical protein [Pseudomonadota bacterium]MBU4356990.1 hypothetical protein [Pseudomonadota bacterium]MCG2771354.1 hypothetical protein [Desulfobacterales bacterium]